MPGRPANGAFDHSPKETTEDFYVAYPTYWEMGRGEELVDLCGTDSGVWRFLDRALLTETFAALLDNDYYASLPGAKISVINTTAQKLLWLMALEKNLTEMSQATAAPSAG